MAPRARMATRSPSGRPGSAPLRGLAPPTSGGDRIAAARGEGVDEERQGRARCAADTRCAGERVLIEREVGRRDDGHSIGPDLGGMPRQRRRVARRLGAGVHDQACHPRRRGRRPPPADARRCESRIPSPVVPQAKTPSAPCSARKATIGQRHQVQAIATVGQRGHRRDDQRRPFEGPRKQHAGQCPAVAA